MSVQQYVRLQQQDNSLLFNKPLLWKIRKITEISILRAFSDFLQELRVYRY